MMMRERIAYFALTILLLASSGCGKKERPKVPEPPVDPVIEYVDGFSWSPKEVAIDKPLRIVFKAEPGSPLHGYSGDVYVHIGIVESGEWLYVPAAWDVNLPKCKMSKIEDSTWDILLEPNPKAWFGAPESQLVPEIGIVVRSQDGKLKGQESDFFIPIKGQEAKHAATKSEAMPSGLKLGINYSSDAVIFVLDDLDRQGKGYDYAYVISPAMDSRRDESTQMKRDPATGYFWYRLPKNSKLNESNASYMQYQLFKEGRAVKIADPYSERVTWKEGQPVSLLKYSVASDDWDWAWTDTFERPKPEKLMIYELLVRDISSGGTIEALRSHLDYIEEMGFNAIELMPIQEFDGNDSWGYNTAFHFAMEESYGTTKQYKQFIDECHRRGIAVILDVVYNHIHESSPLARLYWDRENNRPARNNPWLNPVAPHPYSVFCDFDHSSERTREYIKRNLKYLLEEYKVDGFRFDLSKGFTQKQSNESTASQYDATRVSYLKEYGEAIRAVAPDAYVILEHFADLKEEKELAEAGMMLWRNLNHAYAQTAMGYQEGSAFTALYADASGMPTNSWVGYMESHDEERIAYKQKTWGIEAVKSSAEVRRMRLETNAALFFLVPGPKMVWQFGEIGYDISINQNGRTGRKPVPTATQMAEPERSKLRETYSKLIKLRQLHPELWATGAPMTWQVAQQNWAGGRFITLTAGNKQLKVIGNVNPHASLEYSAQSGRVWQDAMKAQPVVVTDSIIPPGGFLVLLSK